MRGKARASMHSDAVRAQQQCALGFCFLSHPCSHHTIHTYTKTANFGPLQLEYLPMAYVSTLEPEILASRASLSLIAYITAKSMISRSGCRSAPYTTHPLHIQNQPPGCLLVQHGWGGRWACVGAPQAPRRRSGGLDCTLD